MMPLMIILAKFFFMSGIAISLFWGLQIRYGRIDDLNPRSHIVRLLRMKEKSKRGESAEIPFEVVESHSLRSLATILEKLQAQKLEKLEELQSQVAQRSALYEKQVVAYRNQIELYHLATGSRHRNVRRLLSLTLKDHLVQRYSLETTESELFQYPTTERDVPLVERPIGSKYLQ